MKKLLLSFTAITFAGTMCAQDLNKDQMMLPEKIQRKNADAPMINDGYDKEMNVILLEQPYVAKDVSNYRSNYRLGKKVNSPFNEEEDMVQNNKQKPMLPWQKQHPLLWDKPKS